ncbi:hypothetical protein IYX23_17515 [Methylocystis sp. L43]|uniref:hypothetical protein n=1 Tax=unclassified Methylocystis TaxID=2625913 RepID=UPI0018C262AB|nr:MULTISPECIES: hypothetical protein [unclassified Methylocystis]MBG0799470.1 hypothetical protein [Methylocystis sp. L43]MBG0807253.1 hypothetical protein [Methylocystis sp. H15]
MNNPRTRHLARSLPLFSRKRHPVQSLDHVMAMTGMAMTGMAMTGTTMTSTICVARASQKVGARRLDVKPAPVSQRLKRDRPSCALGAGSEKVTDFFDENLLQCFDFERFLIDHMIPCDREAL